MFFLRVDSSRFHSPQAVFRRADGLWAGFPFLTLHDTTIEYIVRFFHLFFFFFFFLPVDRFCCCCYCRQSFLFFFFWVVLLDCIKERGKPDINLFCSVFFFVFCLFVLLEERSVFCYSFSLYFIITVICSGRQVQKFAGTFSSIISSFSGRNKIVVFW